MKTPQSGKEAFECRHKRGNVTQETEMPLRRSNPFKSEPRKFHIISERDQAESPLQTLATNCC